MDTSRAKRVLIIDDDIYTSDMYAINLRSTGYEVDVALTGNDGYNKLTSNDYDVVLLDLILPGLSGTEILHRWRQTMPKGTRPPIIVLTNYEQSNFAKGHVTGESDAYVVKASITPRNLRELIAKVVK